MKTRLCRLVIRNLRSFVGETVIDFPDSGMLLLRGVNLDSKGSSGSGKTSILLAIQYALGICHLPATVLQSWLTEDSIFVELTLETEAGNVVITRSPALSLLLPDRMVPLKGKSAEAELPRVLGLDLELLMALTYRRQQSRGQFLSRGDTDKKDFLSVLLGLEKYEAAAEAAQKKIPGLEAMNQSATTEVLQYKKQYEDFQVKITQPAYLDEEPIQSALRAAEASVQRLQAEISTLKSSLQTQERGISAETKRIADSYLPPLRALQDEFDRQLMAPAPATDRANEQALRLELEKAQVALSEDLERDRKSLATEQAEARRLQTALDRVRREMSAIEALKDRGLRLMSELEALERNTCPTCLQIWVKAQERKTKIEVEISDLALELETVQRSYNQAEVERLQAEIKAAYQHTPHPGIAKWQGISGELATKLAQAKAENDKQMALARSDRDRKLAEIKAQMEQVKSDALSRARCHQANSLEALQGQQERLEDLEGRLRTEQAHAQGCQNRAYQASIRNVEARKQAEADQHIAQDLYNRLVAAQGRAMASAEALAAENDFVALVGREGFLGAIFDEVLWEISDETNKILSGIPNVAHIVVNLRSESTTQKGTIKKSIVPVVSVGGHEAPLAAACSGGMFAAVELAVDLAVAAVVSRRTGAVPSWLILDEAFDGLGVVEKEGCLEILRSYAMDRLVLVVDHSSETKEAFTEFIEVEYQNGQSRIVA